MLIDYISKMRRTDVSISPSHSRVLVSHKIGESIDINTCLTIPRGETMPQIMKPEVYFPAFLTVSLKAL
jgi:hypothetical protein